MRRRRGFLTEALRRTAPRRRWRGPQPAIPEQLRDALATALTDRAEEVLAEARAYGRLAAYAARMDEPTTTDATDAPTAVAVPTEDVIKDALRARARHNYTNHPPSDPSVVARFEACAAAQIACTDVFIDQAPPSRELDLALEAAEQSLMWARAAIARHQDELDQAAAEAAPTDG